MNYAKESDITEILSIFKPYKKEVFPYLRKDTLQEKIRKNKTLETQQQLKVMHIFQKLQSKNKVQEMLLKFCNDFTKM